MAKTRTVYPKRLKALLDEQGMTEAELALRTKLSPHTIHSYLNGEKFPRAENLDKIAKVLGVPVSEMVP